MVSHKSNLIVPCSMLEGKSKLRNFKSSRIIVFVYPSMQVQTSKSGYPSLLEYKYIF